MATVSGLIDTVLAYTEDISATDNDNTTRRARLLQYMQEVIDEIWNFKEWAFKTVAATTVTVAANANSADLPADFQEFGQMGGAWDAQGARMQEIPIQELERVRQGGAQAAANNYLYNNVFAVYGFNTTTSRHKLQVPLQSAAITCSISYQKIPPTLADTTNTTTNGLNYLPVSYHNSVVLAGTVAKAKASTGDARDWESKYRNGLAYMVARERNKKTAVTRIPYHSRMW
jgi:hypothetical protein